jgi:uncharacterized membrane protein YqjE
MPADDSSKRNVATAIAAAGMLICGGGLLGLVALVIPDVIWVVAVVAGMGVIGALQYVVWGWKLDKHRIHDDD